jgi:uncharacterized protein with PIN domain
MSCNARLYPVPRATVKDRVPPRVFKRFRCFARCLGCQRIYWRGTHFLRLEQLVRRVRARAAGRELRDSKLSSSHRR